MPTNRPFLANFLAAFRAHSALQNTSVSTSTGSSATYSTSTSSPSHTNPTATATTSTSARPLTTKTTPSVGVTTAAVQAAVAASATSHLSHHHPHHRHPTTSAPIATPNAHNPAFGTRSRQRRGSDSSSEGGFRDALGNEKWYIGGRTAGGEERFYRLGMVRRERSGDRLSVDRLSL